MAKIPGLNYVKRHSGCSGHQRHSKWVHCQYVNCVFPDSKQIIQNNTDNGEIKGKYLETFIIT